MSSNRIDSIHWETITNWVTRLSRSEVDHLYAEALRAREAETYLTAELTRVMKERDRWRARAATWKQKAKQFFRYDKMHWRERMEKSRHIGSINEWIRFTYDINWTFPDMASLLPRLKQLVADREKYAAETATDKMRLLLAESNKENDRLRAELAKLKRYFSAAAEAIDRLHYYRRRCGCLSMAGICPSCTQTLEIETKAYSQLFGEGHE